MLRLLHRVASHGWVYDRIQDLAGGREVYRRVGRHLSGRQSPHWVLDIGGGTGRTRRVLADQARYVCLDLEVPKLVQFQRAGGAGKPVLGDATILPFRTASVDVAVCVNMTHHLTDDQLDLALREVRRVLHPSGRLIFVDCLLNDRWLAKVLWRLDRGSHPRPAAMLRQAVGRAFQIREEERFRLAHELILLVAQPMPAAAHV